MEHQEASKHSSRCVFGRNSAVHQAQYFEAAICPNQRGRSCRRSPARKRAFAAAGPLKIGYVSPETGALAPFGEADAFVIDQLRKKFQGGIPAGGATRPVELLVRDSQSSSNRAAEVAAQLIKSDKIDMMLVASTPDTVNPVADQCEVNQVPCVSTDAPTEPYFFGRGGKPDKGFDWTYNFFFGVPAWRIS